MDRNRFLYLKKFREVKAHHREDVQYIKLSKIKITIMIDRPYLKFILQLILVFVLMYRIRLYYQFSPFTRVSPQPAAENFTLCHALNGGGTVVECAGSDT